MDVDKFGDRVDHIATVGKASKRVSALTGLQEKPFVLVFNLQLPGDPPISIVSYFVLPPHLREEGEEYAKVLSLFDRFVDIPFTVPAAPTAVKNTPTTVPMSPNIPLTKSVPSSEAAGDSTSNAVGGDSFELTGKELVMGHAVEIIEDYEGLRKPPVTNVVASERIAISESNAKSPDAPNVTAAHNGGKSSTWADSITYVFALFIYNSLNIHGVILSDIIWPEPGPQNPGILDRKSFQNSRFKLIPNIVEGPWVIQMAVG